MGEGQPVHVAEHTRGALRVGNNGERLQFGDELLGLWRGERSPVLLAGKHGARLVEPQHRHHGVLAGFQPVKDALSVRMGRALETPSHSDGIIQNERHARP